MHKERTGSEGRQKKRIRSELAETGFRSLAGESFEHSVKVPNMEAFNRQWLADLGTKNADSRTLGYDEHGLSVILTTEDRDTHMHIMGGTRQGKSRLLQELIQGDIERGYGCCLLDGSENGDTAYNVLKYCASIGFDKVCYINPTDFTEFNRVPVINPFLYEAEPTRAIGNIKDALTILWESKESETPRIDKYVPAVLAAIHYSKSTMADVKYFLDFVHYSRQRWAMINSLPESEQRAYLERAFTHQPTFENHFQPTVNRLNPIADRYVQLMFGSKKTHIPWGEMIASGWCVLVSLSNPTIWGSNTKAERLIGTLIINEILQEVVRLRSVHHWKGLYYLYIDEVGDYASPQVPFIMDKQSKMGISLTVAHQRFDQIRDKNVLSSIRAAGSKVMFHLPNSSDVSIMMRDMRYGGELPLDQVEYVLSRMPKRKAAITINKQNPHICEIVEVPDADVTLKQVTKFKKKIYGREWYHSIDEINQEMNARFATAKYQEPGGGLGNKDGRNTKGTRRRKVSDRKPTGVTKPERQDGEGGKTYFDE